MIGLKLKDFVDSKSGETILSKSKKIGRTIYIELKYFTENFNV